MAKEFEEKLKKDRVAIKSDKDFTLLPLNTEEDMRRALRVVLNELVALHDTIKILQEDKKTDPK